MLYRSHGFLLMSQESSENSVTTKLLNIYLSFIHKYITSNFVLQELFLEVC